MLKLPTVTLCAVTSIKLPETIAVMRDAMSKVEFNVSKIVTHIRPSIHGWAMNLHRPSMNMEAYSHCEELKSLSEYSHYIFHNRPFYTPHVLYIQHDARLLNPDAWTDEFLQYDYIGAPWPAGHITPEIVVGNGGFSLRSGKLVETIAALGLTLNTPPYDNEDVNICYNHRAILERHGIRFAPPALAARFSRELPLPAEYEQGTPFGTHKRNL